MTWSNDSLRPSIKRAADLDEVIHVAFLDDSKQAYTKFGKFLANDDAYWGQIDKIRDITPKEYQAALKRVPDEEIYPLVPDDVELTTVPACQELEDGLFIKRPSLRVFEGDPAWVRKSLLTEALVMEKLSKSPHDNIVTYRGCRVKGPYITGIIIKRHPATLKDMVDKIQWIAAKDASDDDGKTTQDGKSKAVDPEIFMGNIESAVDHLHSLGLAHNDLNPGNIMVDAANRPILIDFESCQEFGAKILGGGTDGWRDKPYQTSEKEHDVEALKRIRSWLDEKIQKKPVTVGSSEKDKLLKEYLSQDQAPSRTTPQPPQAPQPPLKQEDISSQNGEPQREDAEVPSRAEDEKQTSQCICM